MASSHEEKFGPEILDVNHYDSMVWVRFTDGTSVQLSAKQVLNAATRAGPERTANADKLNESSTA